MSKPIVNKVYCAIHIDFTRLTNRFEDESYKIENSVYFFYREIRRIQELTFQQIVKDPNSALILIPSLLLPLDDDLFGALREKMSIEILDWEKLLMEEYLNMISNLAHSLGDRFALLIDQKVALAHSELIESLRKNLGTQSFDINQWKDKNLPFDLADDAQMISFGEYADLCVYAYGRDLKELLRIPPERYRLAHELSLSSAEVFAWCFKFK